MHGGRQATSGPRRLTRAELVRSACRARTSAPGWQHLTVDRDVASRAALSRCTSTRTTISAEDFRLAVGESLGWNRIPSTWFEVSQQGDRFFFHGRGWGHGVGLCQKGAAAMAAQGRSAQQILQQYFPGAQPPTKPPGRAGRRSQAMDSFSNRSMRPMLLTLPHLNRARAEASQRSGLNATQPFTVRAFASTPAFRDATLAPGWVAAFTEGTGSARSRYAHWPRATCSKQPCATNFCMRWLNTRPARSAAMAARRTGRVVERDSEPPANRATATPTLRLDALDAALAHAATEAESEAAHRAAGWYAARLLDRYGRAPGARMAPLRRSRQRRRHPRAAVAVRNLRAVGPSQPELEHESSSPLGRTVRRASSTAAHASRTTQQPTASRYAPSKLEHDSPDLVRNRSLRKPGEEVAGQHNTHKRRRQPPPATSAS